MALEQVFDCPRRIRELRSGPLGGYVDEFCDWLVESGFRRWTVRKHVSNVSHLGRYLDGQTSTDWETISSQDIDGFFQTYPSICRNRNSFEKHVGSVRWSVNRFIQFLSPKGLFTDSREEPIYQPLLDGYLQWMRQYQDVSDGTLKVRRHSITQFLQSLGQEATEKGLAKLSREKIEHFFLDYAQKNGRSARRSMQSALRTFFRFCLHQGYIQQPLDRAVPTLRTYKLATVPRGLTDSQAEQVLCGIDRQTDVGKRNYAILQLLDTYGVRGGQVRALRLEDIDWAAIRAFFGFLSREEPSLLLHCQRVRAIPVKRTEHKMGDHLEEKEMQGVLDSVDVNSRTGIRDKALLLILYNTGARASEIVQLNVTDVRLGEAPQVKLLGKGKKLRSCPLWSETVEALAAYLNQRTPNDPSDQHLFLNANGSPLTRFGIRYIVRKYGITAEKTCPSISPKNVNPHTIRHTTAMHLLRSGNEVNMVSYWLGHADINTTHIYLEIDMEMKRRMLEKTESPTVTNPPPWQKPEILKWLKRVAKAPELCAVA